MIILFDIDGVLIKNRAYHAALTQAVQYFSRRLGAGEHTVTEADILEFEAQSVTVEWDSGAICFAALLLERLRAGWEEDLAPEVWPALAQLGAHPRAAARPDFSALARRVGEATPPGTLPSHTALRLFLADAFVAGAPPAVAALLHHLLDNCYDIDRAPAMQIFQNYAIGDAQYADYYALPPHVPTEPLIEKLDRPALAPEMRDQVLARRAQGGLYVSIYTARPSLPPVEITRRLRGFTPEAEAARHIVGLDPVPVMAFGKLDWLSRRLGWGGADAAGFVKPGILHSMAAIATGRTGLEVESLKAALAVERGFHLRYPLAACAHETVHVFEDSASSLKAVTRAVEVLNQQGLNLKLVRHGIGPAGSSKRGTLEKVADVVHEDVNEGLATIL